MVLKILNFKCLQLRLTRKKYFELNEAFKYLGNVSVRKYMGIPIIVDEIFPRKFGVECVLLDLKEIER